KRGRILYGRPDCALDVVRMIFRQGEDGDFEPSIFAGGDLRHAGNGPPVAQESGSLNAPAHSGVGECFRYAQGEGAATSLIYDASADQREPGCCGIGNQGAISLRGGERNRPRSQLDDAPQGVTNPNVVAYLKTIFRAKSDSIKKVAHEGLRSQE